MSKPDAALTLVLAAALGLGAALAASAADDALAQEQTQAYVVQKGDTLSSIARAFYGKSSLGSALWRANRELVAHPRRLTAGDTIYIFPESTLALKRPINVPPAPMRDPEELYEREQPLQMAFPKYFSYAADPRGQGATGITRIRVKKTVTVPNRDPHTGEILDGTSNEIRDELYEVHMVGEIIASSDRGAPMAGSGLDSTAPGRLLLSTGDNVVVRFTEDVAKLRDSDTYEDSDPYFATFPIYSLDMSVRETDRRRPDFGANLGDIFHYKGRLQIVARVEGLVPPNRTATSRAVRRGANGPGHGRDLDPVSYVARITYSEDAIHMNDKVLLFIPTDPGPERRLDAPYVEEPGSYASPGR
ncbi:MAG: LysM peptidoglycan-binding domain-containing protein [Deltaproteobacteria bacterium]|jgi:hypothetical protein|nr:LysM peptidoglycan-binding domain-containing protein [Deltaproteobacteria bacterium]